MVTTSSRSAGTKPAAPRKVGAKTTPRKTAAAKVAAPAGPAAKSAVKSRSKDAAASHKTRRRPTTIAEYIDAAPREGRAHLHRLHALLKAAAPHAQEAIKWGQPFYIEPRFLFAFSAHKAHVSFAPNQSGLAPFRGELAAYDMTVNFLKVRYDQPLPEDLIRRIAAHRVREVAARTDDAFW